MKSFTEFISIFIYLLIMIPSGRIRVEPNFSRKINTERAVAKNLLNGFIMKGSNGEKLIEEIIGVQINKISLTALIEISKLISDLTNIKFPRNYKRKKDLIVKWFDDNIDTIKSVKDYIHINYNIQENTNGKTTKK